MKIEKVYNFIDELSRCEWHDNAIVNGIKYNGITIEQGTEAYQQRLEAMQSDAEVAILTLASSGQDKVINAIYNKAKEVRENDYDIITYEAVEALKAEFPLPRREDIRKEIELGLFIIDMHNLQLSYLDKLLTFISSLLDCNTTTTEKTATLPEANPTITNETDNDNNKRIIKGVNGLAQHLGIGPTKAQEVLNSGILQDKGIAYRYGKAWRVDAEKLDNLLAKEPYIFHGDLTKYKA